MNFENKTILITGASTGIGKALAVELSKENCSLILLARRIELLEELKYNLGNNKASIYVEKCNVGNKEEVDEVFGRMKEIHNRIDIAILNAGVGHHVDVFNYDSSLAEDTFNANVMGIIYLVEKLLPELLERREGIIAGVSSLADNRGYSGSGFYCASKAAASIYLEGLRLELKQYGIKVITIKPGFVKTPMTDKNKFEMPFLMSAEKAAGIILRGIRKQKRIIQFPLPTVLSSRLIGMLPGSIYEFLSEHLRKDE